jgi:hypothetical protein
MPKRSLPDGPEPLGSPNGRRLGCPKAEIGDAAVSSAVRTLLTCAGFKPHKELKFLRIARLQALRDHF